MIKRHGNINIYGDPSDLKPHPKRKRIVPYDEVIKEVRKVKSRRHDILSNNPDARRSGFDARNSDIKIMDATGKTKKIIKNKAVLKQGNTDWETVKRAR